MSLRISIIENDQARAALADPRFLAEWAALYGACPWATEYQSISFLTAWFEVFQDWYAPLCITGRAADGALLGLIWLAKDHRKNRIICAGAGQAEYHGWLARPDVHERFADAALTAYCARADASPVAFNLVLSGMPLDWACGAGRWGNLILHEPETRPLIETSPAGALKGPNKNDKKKLNALKKKGVLEFIRIRSAAELTRLWPSIAEQYDKRIATAAGTMSFAANPEFGRFFLACMEREGGLVEGFALTLDGALIASMITQRCRDCLVIIVLTFDESLAAHSPGRLLTWMAADAAGQDGFRYLDLSPYGAWKHAMATAAAPVTTLTLFPSRTAALVEQGRRMTKRLVKQGLTAMGVDYHQIIQDRLRRRRA